MFHVPWLLFLGGARGSGQLPLAVHVRAKTHMSGLRVKQNMASCGPTYSSRFRRGGDSFTSSPSTTVATLQKPQSPPLSE